MYNIYETNNEQQGACVSSRLRVGCIAQTRKPDLDNANVGRYRR